MAHQSDSIRVLALGIIRCGDRLFLSQGYDASKQQTFYRALGGGVDFGEYSRDALIREFQEEIQAHLTNIRYITCMENIFVYNDRPGHELIQLYQCDFANPQWYEIPEVTFWEGDRQKKALWVEMERLASGELRLVPEQFLQYC
ncbi:NUDIX hydrolase [Geitlerinema sp. PCC 9228]|jgi:8-oxo-dGTP pyrophosphatase MutT (NUDIX family)|uniref:NUDIX hydrolase n=1 Tax=Geitlerinema sp. PCC 9228 TaxID=111611 RepID=UPI0008F9A07F|nr:NUDIX hydrolase [Geitlerinema sp. PCC 9228]